MVQLWHEQFHLLSNDVFHIHSEYFPAHFTEFAVFVCHCAHLDTKDACTDYVSCEFCRYLAAFDGLSFLHTLVQIFLQVLRALDYKVKHFSQLAGCEYRREHSSQWSPSF